MDNNNNMNNDNNTVNPMFTQPNPEEPVVNPEPAFIPQPEAANEPVSLNKEASGEPVSLNKEPEVTPDFNQTADNLFGNGASNADQSSFNYDQNAQNTFSEVNPHDNDTAAIIMLILGILSIFCCWPSGIAAIIMWFVLKGKFSPEKEGIAKGGFICGCIGVGLVVLGVVANILISLLTGGVSILAMIIEAMNY